MKQGKRYTTVILWILLAAIVAYLGFSIVSSLRDPLATTAAIEYEAGAGYYASGFLVRSEALIESEYDITVFTAAEGLRVAAGQPIATGYLSEDARQRQTRITELSAQIEQLGFADDFSSNMQEKARLDSKIASDLAAFSTYLYRHDMNSVAALSPELKGYILCRSSDSETAKTITAQLARAKQELARLQTSAEEDTKVIAAPKAGYFSSSPDGYESVLTPDALETITTVDYGALQPESVPANNAGKMILGNKWYFLTAIPANELPGISRGDTVTVKFARDFYEYIEMKVERVGKNEAGQRILVLSSEYFLQNVVLFRQQSAELTYVSYRGLRVPKTAVRVDENGQSGVFILEGANAKWKPIEILHDNGESYVVKLDRSQTANLWPGDDIIVNAKDIYDGKIVRGT